MWLSNCHQCTCNNRTRMEECAPRQPLLPVCSDDGVLVNTSCCGDQVCGECTLHLTCRSNLTGLSTTFIPFLLFHSWEKVPSRRKNIQSMSTFKPVWEKTGHFSLQSWLDHNWVPTPTYLWLQIGDTWTDAANPCTTFSCSKNGVQAGSPVCPAVYCPEVGPQQLLPKRCVHR